MGYIAIKGTFSHIWRHWDTHHREEAPVEEASNLFTMKVIQTHARPLERQLGEAIKIATTRRLWNTKEEWNQYFLSQLHIRRDDPRGEENIQPDPVEATVKVGKRTKNNQGYSHPHKRRRIEKIEKHDSQEPKKQNIPEDDITDADEVPGTKVSSKEGKNCAALAKQKKYPAMFRKVLPEMTSES